VISELIAFEFLMRLRYGQRDVHIAPNYTAEPEPRTHSVLLDSQVWMCGWWGVWAAQHFVGQFDYGNYGHGGRANLSLMITIYLFMVGSV